MSNFGKTVTFIIERGQELLIKKTSLIQSQGEYDYHISGSPFSDTNYGISIKGKEDTIIKFDRLGEDVYIKANRRSQITAVIRD